MGISTNFVADLESELQRKLAERLMLVDQLQLIDAQIVKYDAIIRNMDRSILPLIDQINVAISSVKTAYDNRIAVGCKSNLYWQAVSTNVYKFGLGLNQSVTYTNYQVVKNPSVSTTYGNWGAKYYRRPQNQDYGSNIVKDFIGSVGLGQTNLAVTGVGGTLNLLPGDTITDSIIAPSVFNSANLPTIVSFGTSSIVVNQVSFGGSVSVGSTIIAHVGVGTSGSITVGSNISLSGVLQPNTTVVGFGTTSYSVEFWDNTTSRFISSSVTTDSLIISASAIGLTTNGVFTVGVVSTFPSIFLSTSAVSSGSNTLFTAIRTTQSTLTSFDYTNNPVDPVTIGIMSSNTIGYGHTLVRVNNGSSSGPFQWREVLGPVYGPEPACGNGAAVYYPGDLNFPGYTVNTYTAGGVALASTFFYATEGTTVSTGGTITSITVSYASTSSLNPSASVCNAATAAITAAESSRDAILAQNQPIIDSTISSASVLRRLRDKLESSAFSILQGKAYTEAEINRIRQDLNTIRVTDFSQYEPTSFVTPTRFSTNVTGVGTT